MAPSESQHVLVTGGSGFIGSHLVGHLLSLGHSVDVVDDLSTGRLSNLEDEMTAHPDRLRFFESDLAEWLVGPGGKVRFDSIYHLAAAVGVKLVVEDPISTIETNIVQTSAILEYVRAHGTPLFIASTSEVYGKSESIPFHEENDITFGPTSRSRWSYACSKAIDEYLGLAHSKRYGIPIVIARFFNTVGPRQLGKYGMVLPSFVNSALSDLPLQVYGDGHQSRCFCDVRDIVPVLPRLLAESACHGRVFNLGNDQSITINDLARLVCDTLDSKSEIRKIPYEEAYAPGFEDLSARVPDLSRIREVFDFIPSYPLARTIQDLAQVANIRNEHS
jgi:UDP-glucose 4-epimerase